MFNYSGTMAVRSLAAIGLTVAALGLTGCTKSVSSADLERTVSEGIAKASGSKVEKLECPDKLEAKVGANVRCTLTDKGKKYGVTVTVTSVENDTAKYDFKVDDQEMK